MASAKQQSIRLSAEDVAILEEIQRRTGLFGSSDAVRFALRQYARAEGIEILREIAKVTKPHPRPKARR